jgi:hypothetical protein
MVKTFQTPAQQYAHDKSNFDIFNDYDFLWGKESDSTTPWSESDILCLCEKLLESSLASLLDSRRSWNTGKEIYFWILNESDKNPFSFNNCCQFTGVDHDVIRDFVMQKFKPQLLRQLH